MNNKLMIAAITVAALFFSCSQAPPNENNAAASAEKTNNTASKDEGPIKGQAYVDDGISVKNILQVAMASPDHTTLAAGVAAAGLENVLANNGPLTVFAPTNAAFDKLPEGTLDELLKPENRIQLSTIITFHAAPGKYYGNLFKDGQKLFMATGHYVDVEIKDDGTYVNGSKILGTIEASNGVVHVVDNVWLPPEES